MFEIQFYFKDYLFMLREKLSIEFTAINNAKVYGCVCKSVNCGGGVKGKRPCLVNLVEMLRKVIYCEGNRERGVSLSM